jgi:hypothetical protein
MENTNTDDFGGFGEEGISDIDFFNVEDNQEPPEPAPSTDPTLDKSTEKEERKVKEEESLFESKDEEDEEEEEDGEISKGGDGEENKEEKFESNPIHTLSALKNKGYLDYTLEEGEELTEEKAEEILEDSMGTMFDTKLEGLFDSMPDIVKELNKYVINGGNINTFLDKVAVQNSAGISSDMDLENEANQETVIRHGLTEEGYDEEYIDEQIDFLKGAKRLKKHSETHYKKWENKKEQEQKDILASQENTDKAAQTKRRELKNKVSTFLADTEEISGFKISKEDKKELPNYMSDRDFKTESGGQITRMQRDLMKVLNSEEGAVQMAKLLKDATKDGELNFDKIKKITESKVVKEVKDNVRRSKKSITGGGDKNSKRSLASYFDND